MRKPLARTIPVESKKIIAIDFDNTLAITDYPIIKEPNTELIEFIRKHQNDYVFILWTMREGKQLHFAKEWIKQQGIRFDFYNQKTPWNIQKYGDRRKIYADYYIDDHNISIHELERLEHE